MKEPTRRLATVEDFARICPNLTEEQIKELMKNVEQSGGVFTIITIPADTYGETL